MSLNNINKLAILIPTIVGREEYLNRLLAILNPQVEKYKDEVIIFIDKDDKQMTIGQKRNRLTEWAVSNGCTHRAFIDDDDIVTDDYIELNIVGVRLDYDVNSLTGIYYENGKYDRYFVHDIKYKEAKTNSLFYERFPNHLNVTKLSLIKDYKYEHKNFGEDMEHAERISKDGVLKNQYTIEKPVYSYFFRTKTNGI
jgi:uncharacterized protein YutD